MLELEPVMRIGLPYCTERASCLRGGADLIDAWVSPWRDELASPERFDDGPVTSILARSVRPFEDARTSGGCDECAFRHT